MPRSSDVGTPVLLLDPPATPKDPRYPLKADENYQFMLSDAEVDRQAREQPHGHVTPRPDGARAKCGGTARSCGGCRREAEILTWEQTSPSERIQRQMERLRSTVEYRAIAGHYGNRRAERSGVSYLDHIEQGMAVMLSIGAPVEAILAYCLHPLCQSDADLATFDPPVASTPTVLMYVMEYRNVANRFLSFHFQKDTRDATPSPIVAVNQMLIADKVQNRKDFEIYHALSHPNRYRLHGYFTRWLRVLGIDESEYERLADLCASVSSDGVAG